MEHAQRVSDFSALADQILANQRLTDELGKAVAELDISRQVVQEARQQLKLKQHTVDHRCDHFPGLNE